MPNRPQAPEGVASAAAGPHPAARWPEAMGAARQRLDAAFRAVPMRAALGAELVDWGLGWAEHRLVPTNSAANLVGTVHGGVLATLADLSFEVACNSYGRVVVATGLTAHYAAAAEIGTPLRAVADEVSRSQRLASYRIEVHCLSDGTTPLLVAWFQATAYRTNRWHLEDAAFPGSWRERY